MGLFGGDESVACPGRVTHHPVGCDGSVSVAYWEVGKLG